MESFYYKMKIKNICMTCGKKSINRFEYRVVEKDNGWRDFCSTECLLKYFKLYLKQKKK